MSREKQPRKVITLFPGYNAVSDKENNVIGKRLLRERKREGIVIADLCDRLASVGIKVSHSAVYRWESGEVVPNAYQLVALAHVLNIEDDISGFSSAPRVPQLNDEGLRRLQEYRDDLVASGNYTPRMPVEEIEYIDMPISFLAASAGTGEFLDEGNFEMVSFPKSSVPAGAEFGIRVHGDSMEPVYQDGQIVWVQQCSELESGEEGIFIYDGCGYIKLLQLRDPDEALADRFTDSQGVRHQQAMLISYNKAYKPILIPPESDFRVVGRVL